MAWCRAACIAAPSRCAIAQRGLLASHHLYHAIRGTLAAELGRLAEALTHFRQASDLAALPAERAFIARRIAECGG